MNPLKAMKDVIPALSKVLESIHAHLEEQLECQKEILKEVKELNELQRIRIKDNKDINIDPVDNTADSIHPVGRV